MIVDHLLFVLRGSNLLNAQRITDDWGRQRERENKITKKKTKSKTVDWKIENK